MPVKASIQGQRRGTRPWAPTRTSLERGDVLRFTLNQVPACAVIA
jgi:hypothetical protein